MLLENKKINYHTFFRTIEYFNDIDPNFVFNNFKLDVKLNNDKTELYYNDLIVDKAIKILPRKPQNKYNKNIPIGYTKIIYDGKYNPPEFIPIGSYCRTCKIHGPFVHDENCRNINLYFNGLGLKNNSLSEKINEKTFSDNYESNIMVASVYDVYNNELKSNGPLLINYMNEQGRSNIIRLIPNNKKIMFVSNSFMNVDLFKNFIEKLKIDCGIDLYVKKINIHSIFATTNIINYDSLKNINLEMFYTYLNEFYFHKNKINSFSKLNNNFLFNLKFDKRLYITFVNLNNNVSGPFKITVQIFPQGHIQFSSSSCSARDTDINIIENNLPHDLKLKYIIKLFEDIKKLLIDKIYEYINSLNDKEKNLFIIDAPIKLQSNKIYPTVLGIIPYIKRKQFKINDKINIFNDTFMSWDSDIYKITNIIEKNKVFEICLENNPNETKIVNYQNIRRTDSNNDQVCRLLDEGINRLPVPYSFYGNCSGGLNLFINPLGVQSRSDNRFYPTCSDVNFSTRNWIINFLLNGFSEKEIEEYKINDIRYSGVLDKECVNIGSKIVINDLYSNKETEVIIIDKYKTHGLGNDKNKVIYKVLDISEEKEYEITGEQFSLKYYENRFFEGLNNINCAKDILLECFEEFGLLDSDYLFINNKNKKIIKEIFDQKNEIIDQKNEKNEEKIDICYRKKNDYKDDYYFLINKKKYKLTNNFNIKKRIVLQVIDNNYLGLIHKEKVIKLFQYFSNYSKNDFVSVKINIMLNNEINKINPIIEVKKVDSSEYEGFKKTINFIETLIDPFYLNE